MDLPMTRDDAQELVHWLKGRYGSRIATAVDGTPFTVDIACAIACQETGIHLLGFTRKLAADDALARCVFDASGDADGTSRGAFPRNTPTFRAAYGDAFADTLIAEANATRVLRGLRPASWVYKGYGLFQYDLQAVREDEAFFREKQWGTFDACLARLVAVLMKKHAATGDTMQSVRAYNGSGARADAYLANVRQFIAFSEQVH